MNSVSSLIDFYPNLYIFNHISLKDFLSQLYLHRRVRIPMAQEFKPEEYAPPPPPSPPEILKKVGELLATLMRAPPEAIGVVKNVLDKGAAEVAAGPPK